MLRPNSSSRPTSPPTAFAEAAVATESVGSWCTRTKRPPPKPKIRWLESAMSTGSLERSVANVASGSSWTVATTSGSTTVPFWYRMVTSMVASGVFLESLEPSVSAALGVGVGARELLILAKVY